MIDTPSAADDKVSAAPTRVVIVGAGFAGLALAHGLSRLNIHLTVIDRQNYHLFQPLLYQVATAGLSPADIAGPIRTILNRHPRPHILLDAVVSIDKTARRVLVASGATVDYDLLIVATGARHSFFGREEWGRYASGLKTIDDATRVRRTILLAMERAETMRQENIRDRNEFLTFVVVGGGPTGVEMAGAIAELTRNAAEMDFHYVTPKCVRILLLQSGGRLLPSFPASLGEAARRALVKLGVEVRLNARVTDIGPAAITVGTDIIATTTVIWAAGVQASAAGDWLGASCDANGRVVVGGDLSLPGHPEVFVIGDTACAVDAAGRSVPGVAPAAKQQGEYVAGLIAGRLRGRGSPPPFRYRDRGAMATIGRQSAVVDLGWLRLSGLAAWLLWSTAHIYFLVGFRSRLVVGATWIWNYLTFERGARLITGGEMS